jgi:tRNA threonylcarbamoyladenosine biosynthesis protein TsaB
MIVLAIESASTQLGVAVVGDDVASTAFEAPGARRHTELLGPAIAAVLETASLALADLDAIVVDIGPGLFTGLRTGVATAKGLALGAGLPVVGVRSTEALRRAVQVFPGAVVAALDVRRSEVAYEFPGDGRAVIGGAEELLERVDALIDAGSVVLVGNGWRSMGDAVMDRVGKGVILAGAPFETPSATVLGRIGLEALVEGRTESALSLAVDYLREADVAINWARRAPASA